MFLLASTRSPLPATVSKEENKLVEEAVVAKKLVEVACVPVAIRKFKFVEVALVAKKLVVVALVVVERSASNPTKCVLVEDANSGPWNQTGVVVAEEVRV
jgi:hypothetical protein